MCFLHVGAGASFEPCGLITGEIGAMVVRHRRATSVIT